MNETGSAVAGPAMLHQAVSMTHGARRITALAESVDMIALNSAFAARRVGAAGFTVVSRELRGFSGQLAGTMSALATAVARLVDNAANLLDNARRRRLMARTAAGMRGERRLDAALARQRDAATHTANLVERHRVEIDRLAGQAMRLCGWGLHLARNGRIEASGAGSMAAQLHAVAAEIDSAVSAILAELDGWKKTGAAP